MPKRTIVQNVGLLIALLGLVIPNFIEIPDLDAEGSRMLGIFIFAIVSWITTAIPLTATAIAVILFEVLLVSSDALLSVGDGVLAPAEFFSALANPVIILFLGGFLIADGAAKFNLDKAIAAKFLRPFASNLKLTMLGLMSITAVLSMFMSNTATTATMFAIVLPILASIKEPTARSGLALSIPFAANVGGMGTPVGTPPNAIALAALNEVGIQISFVEWMVLAVPPMLVLLALTWFYIVSRFVKDGDKVELDLNAKFEISAPAVIFYIIAGATVVLWMTEPIHGIASTTVGWVPVVLLLATQVMSSEDVKALDWPVLWLVAGGIALGTGVGATGMDDWIIGLVDWNAMSTAVLLAAIGGLGWALANVISHSAAANLLVPIAVAMAASLDVSAAVVGVVVALATSVGMALPISTPPNAIAFSTGSVSMKNMAVTGLILGFIGTVIIAVVMPYVWQGLGLL